jgi:hypothetical protein
MDKFADVIKIFIEKDLIPSVISIAGALITLLIMPEENWIIVKIGKLSVSVLSFCICFLAIQLFVKIISGMKKAASNVNEFNYRMKRNEIENQEAINQINEFVDQLAPEDKEILLTFIKNGNKILIAYDRMGFGSLNSLLDNTNIMNITSYDGDISDIDTTRYWITSDLEQTLNQGMRLVGGFKKYKIKDSFFHDLELVYKTTGKLGNF